MAKMFKQMGRGGLAQKMMRGGLGSLGMGRQTTLRAVETILRSRMVATTSATMTTLQDQLDEITANTRHLVQAERMAVGERAVAELFASGIEERILPVGALAPEFALKDATGRLVRSRPTSSPSARSSSNSFAAAGAPTAHRARSLARPLRHRSASTTPFIVAISPQTERQNDFMAGQHGLPFPVLSDPGSAVAEKFGLVYTVPEYHRAYYLSILVNIPFINGDPGWRLPFPATYVIGREGRVALRRSPRRLPRPPRARRSSGRRARPPRPLDFSNLVGEP